MRPLAGGWCIIHGKILLLKAKIIIEFVHQLIVEFSPIIDDDVTRHTFLLAKSTKNVFRGVNFTNLKTLGGYIVKSKLQGVCLQLTQTLEVIM